MPKTSRTGTKLKNKIRVIIFVLIIFILGISLFIALKSFFNESSFFKIRKISSNISLNYKEFDYLLGESLFSVNLGELKLRMQKEYPASLKVEVLRKLPDELVIEINPRKPLAVLKLKGDFYLLDSEAVLISRSQNKQYAQFPVIEGLDNQIVNPKIGLSYDNINLAYAILLVKEASGLELDARGYKLSSIDLSSGLSNIAFTISRQDGIANSQVQSTAKAGIYGKETKERVEIRIGSEEYKKRLDMLERILRKESDLSKIKYIDLRFKDPTISFKENNVSK